MWVCVHTSIVHVHVCMYIYSYARLSMYIFKCVCMCASMYVYVYVQRVKSIRCSSLLTLTLISDEIKIHGTYTVNTTRTS